MLGHLVFADDLADRDADLVRHRRAGRRRPGPAMRPSSFSVAASSSCAFAGTFGGQGGVAAGDQPFAGVVGVGDLGQVLGVEQAHLQRVIEHLWGKQRIMEVYLNNAETGIGTYGVNAASERYYGHDASAMTPIEAARIAAVLPLPKERGAVAPKGFTRALRQYDRGADRDCRSRRARCVRLQGRCGPGEQGAAAGREEGTAAAGRGI